MEDGLNGDEPPGAVDDPFEYVHRYGLLTPDHAAVAINRQLDDEDENFAFRLVLQSRDHLRLAAGEVADGRRPWRRRERRVFDDRYDVLYRAVIGHEFSGGTPKRAAAAYLPSAWIMRDPFRDEETMRSQTPVWLEPANIVIAARGLTTA